MPKNARSGRMQPPAPVVANAGPRYVDGSDARIAYRVSGKGDVPVLVLQPFWTEMEDVLDDRQSLVSQLAGSSRIIVHDRRGTGQSERHPARLTMDALVEDIAAVLTHAGVDSAVVLGMGESGPLAVHFATERPERVARLILVDPALRPLKGPGSAMLLHTLRSKPRAGLRALARTLVDDDDTATELGAHMARAVDGPTAARLYETFLNADAISLLPQVVAPALLAYGVFDGLVSEDEARSVQGKMPNARIGFVEGAAGDDTALREGWVQIRDFLDEYRRQRPAERARIAPIAEPEPAPRRPARSKPQIAQRVTPVDYVPAGRPPKAAPPQPQQLMGPPILTSSPSGRPMMVAWGPPQDIPPEAIALNRKGIDQLLIGQIEAALESFQKAIDVAPHYEDALINHRELLTRLVQQRVAEWQTKQAEEAMAEAERRAAQWARRAANGRRKLGWLLRRSG